MDQTVSPRFTCRGPNPQDLRVCLFGDRVFKEVILKMRSLGQALIQYDHCPYKKRKLGHRHVKRDDHMRTLREGGRLQAGTEVSEVTSPAGTLISKL